MPTGLVFWWSLSGFSGHFYSVSFISLKLVFICSKNSSFNYEQFLDGLCPFSLISPNFRNKKQDPFLSRTFFPSKNPKGRLSSPDEGLDAERVRTQACSEESGEQSWRGLVVGLLGFLTSWWGPCFVAKRVQNEKGGFQRSCFLEEIEKSALGG